MTLITWEPSGGLGTLQREMNRLLESFFGGSPWRFDASMSAPAVEVADTQDTVVVKAQVPGVSKEQLQVTVSEGLVTIKGEMKEEEKQEEKNYLHREFRYGAFKSTVTLRAG